MQQNKCMVCGKTFESKHGALFCSSYCNEKSRLAIKDIKPIFKTERYGGQLPYKYICSRCNKTFFAKRSGTRFCSNKCATTNYERKCQECGKSYKGTKTSKFCSRNCNGKHKIDKLQTHPNWAKGPSLGRPKIRFCSGCAKDKKSEEFRLLKKNTRTRGWLDYKDNKRYTKCKMCESRNMSIRYREKPWVQIYSGRKKHAKKHGIPFTITQEYLKNLYETMPDKCPVLGVPFKRHDINKSTSKTKSPYSPSLDRLIPSKGYVPGNLVLICDWANRIKQDATIEQVEMLYKYLKKNISKKD